MNIKPDALTPLYARVLLKLTAPFPNFDLPFIKGLRVEATRSLHLKAGDRVLDVGCGMGGCFSFLREAVGPTGEVVGVEISPDTVASARRRIEVNHWKNVQVIRAPAQSAALEGMFDGLVMFAAPDVYASAQALEHLLPHLRVGARIFLFGGKTTHRCAGVLLNPLFKLAARKLSFPTTPVPDNDPWRLVGAVTDRLEINEHFFGAMFSATGSLAQGWEVALREVAAAEKADAQGRCDAEQQREDAFESLGWHLPQACHARA